MPDQALLPAGAGDGGDRCRATQGAAGGYAFVCVPTGKPVTVDLGRLAGERVRAWWFDPRTGAATPTGEAARAGTREYTPPTAGPDADRVLVLDDASKNYPPARAG